MNGTTRIYRGAQSARGPLLTVRGARRAALAEWARIESGDEVRRGQVIEVSRDGTVIQLFEDTVGLSPVQARVALTGEVARAVVGVELFGRVLSGAGAPLDALPAPVGTAITPVWAPPINPVRRRKPHDLIETGLSAIDGMNTLVRGQKLPIFSGAGLPGLDLAAQIVAGARTPRDEPFAVVFVAIGITQRESQRFIARFEGSDALARTVFYLNRTGDPTIERLLAPRLALSQAEHLAFDCGMHVLVVLADCTNYCEALRELGAAREEIPGRRGYPGYMYTDLASLFERAGLLRDGAGSVTQIPILSMPDDDITHPIPDLTGYITEGQLVLSRELDRKGIFPPIDVLPSLSRLMNAGIGAQTAPEHRRWADQLYATYAQGREARFTAAIVGESGLPAPERRALGFAERFEREFVHQGAGRRTVAETLETGWRLLESLPRDDLTRLSEAAWARREGRGP
ncbi:MAG TPA: V-type ATP synthase subunit B [Gemmatimonadales bacterium]|nr:V-type ATP synthase subunit B [Gemmatimonadales bacterium]